jgi:hypothetical protein
MPFPAPGFSSFPGHEQVFQQDLLNSLYCDCAGPEAQSENQEIYMSPLTLQEVIDRINQAHSPPRDWQAQDDYVNDKKHRPEAYIPRITRLLAKLIFST